MVVAFARVVVVNIICERVGTVRADGGGRRGDAYGYEKGLVWLLDSLIPLRKRRKTKQYPEGYYMLVKHNTY